ncbi:MAG: adenosine kinase [Alphaproteobacteria bacterium]
MATVTLDVVGIGNAIVDVLVHADDALLAEHGLTKGAMTLVDSARAEAVYDRLGPAVECSGGSAANTMAGIAALGGRAAFIGKVRDDQLGAVFAHDIRAIGVRFNTPAASAGPPTARSLILVTPDAQRTMCTCLGAAVALAAQDVDEATIAAARVTYLEGYLWDPPEAKRAFRRALEVAHAHGRRVALTLSDPFCVERHRDEFRELVADGVDILFANEVEIASLYQVADFEAALERARRECPLAVLTRSARGSVVLKGEETHRIAAAPVDRVVDTTGAGDLYASGFLYGLTHGFELSRCGRLGALAAAEVISHVGARPEADLAELAALEFD